MVYGWTPSIGDHSILGWLTAIAYGLAALLCGLASNRSDRHDRRIWMFLAVAGSLLSLNKQLDLQSLFTAAARHFAHRDGWYEQRHLYQEWFIALLSFLTLLGGALLVRLAYRAPRPVKVASFGMLLLIVFILVRASSFHKVDWFLGLGLAGVRTNHLMELSGIAVIAVSALASLRTAASEPTHQRPTSARRRV